MTVRQVLNKGNQLHETNLLSKQFLADNHTGEIGVSHSVKDDDDVLLGCDAAWNCRKILTFRRNTLSPSSGLNKAAFATKVKLWETVRLSFASQKLQNNLFICICV
jgi:hypothetical protein